MIRRFFFLLIFASSLSSVLLGDFPRMQQGDVRRAMQEILSYHVETNRVTPHVMQRAVNNFIQKFDPGKIYLKEDEIAPFISLSSSELKGMVNQYQRDDLDTFLALNQVIEHSIERSQNLREEIVRELVIDNATIERPRRETYLHYAKSDRELRKRIRSELMTFLSGQVEASAQKNPAQKEKVLDFFLKKVNRGEQLYIPSNEEDQHQLVVHTLKAMAMSLDAHTSFYTPQEALELRTVLEKEFEGVGVVLKEEPEGIIIANLIKGGPAERSGLLATGDRLTHINKASTDEMTYDEVLSSMKQGSQVVLSVVHKDGASDTVSLKKERIELSEERVKASYIPFGEGIIGKIELPSFYGSAGGSSSEKDVLQALRDLKKQGELVGLILDLRENAGGFLSEAVKVASLFVKSGVIVISKYARNEVQYLRDVDPRVHYDGPLLILTSQASASAAEIVAQALQDYGIALIAGDKHTYGKGSIQYQTITDPSANTFFKVTIGRYYTVSGRSTQINGVRADLVVPTHYSVLKIGERYLDYPLAADRIDSAYVDPLHDVRDSSRLWFKKYYLPNTQQRTSYWRQMIPHLEKNSQRRIDTNLDYQLFLQKLKKEPTSGSWGKDDLQMAEAVEIVRDMITLHREKSLANQ